MKLKVDTSLINSVIDQRVYFEDVDPTPYDPIRELSRWVINTREEGIRKALIELGWTPPEDE